MIALSGDSPVAIAWRRFVDLVLGTHFVPQRMIEQENELTEIMEHLKESARRNEEARVMLNRMIARQEKYQHGRHG